MLRAIKPCKLLSGWTNIIRANQTRAASTAFGVQPAWNNNAANIPRKNDARDRVDRSFDLEREVVRNNFITEKNFQLSLNSIKANNPNQNIISLIQCFGVIAGRNTPEERINYVNQIWDKIKHSGVKLDVTHYNALLRVYIDNEHKFSATEILEDMKKNNVKPNRVTYRYLLSSFCREGDLSGASSILEMMKEESILYNEGVFHELILGHCIAKDINGAENIIKIMKEKNFDVGSSTYATYLCGLALSGDMEKFNSVLKKCQEDGIIFRREYLYDIFYNLVLSGHTDRACEMIQSHKPVFRDGLFKLLLRILNKKMYMECMEIASFSHKETIDRNIEDVMCRYITERAPFETIVNIAKELEKKGEGTDFLLTALYYTLKKKDSNMSLNIIKHLRDNGHALKETYFWPMVASAVQEQSVDKVLNVLTTMRHEFGLKFSRTLLTKVIFQYFSDPVLEQRLLSGLYSLGTLHSYIQENYALSCVLKKRMDKVYELSEHIKPNMASLVAEAIAVKHKSRSPAKVVSLIKNVASHAGRRGPAEEMPNELSEGDNSENVWSSPQDVVDNVVKIFASNLRESDQEFLKEVLEEMVRCKLPISMEAGECIKERITNPDVGGLVDELVKLPPLEASDNVNDQNDEESKSIRDVKARFLSFCRRDMVEEAIQLTKEHPEVLDFYTPFLLALKRTNNEEKLNEYLTKFVAKIRENGKNTDNSMFLIAELFRNGFIKEATELLNSRGSGFKSRRVTRETLGPLLDKASVNDITTLLSAIGEKEQISLADIVRYYSQKKNFGKIIEILEELDVQRAGKLRLVENIIKPLAEDGDTEMVKKVVSVLEKKFSPLNVVNELIFSYAFLGEVKKARECLDKYHRRSYFFPISAVNIQNDKVRVNVLENLVEILTGFKGISKRQIYDRLIEDYETLNMDPQKGLTLWERLQEDNLVAGPVFLTYLARLLRKNNMPVPFDYSNFENQEWLLNCNIPRPVLNELFLKYHFGDMPGVEEVIRQGIKKNFITSNTLQEIIRSTDKKEEAALRDTLEKCLSLAEYNQALHQGTLIQRATKLTQSSDPKIVLEDIPHTFLVDCLMTESFDGLPNKIAKIILWAYTHEFLEDEQATQMYETDVKDLITDRPIVEGLLKYAQYLTVRQQILDFLLSRKVFHPFGLEKEAAFLSRLKGDGSRRNNKQREQSSVAGTQSEGMSSTDSTNIEQVFGTAESKDEMSYSKSNEEEVVGEVKREAQAVPSSSGSS